jgi:glycosyltransferase involved in cell wall biosynthesis
MKRLKVLFLSHFVPYPPKGGCFQRNYNLLTRIAAAHEVHLVAMRHKSSTHPEAETGQAKEELLRHCSAVDIIDIAGNTEPAGMARLALEGLPRLLPLNVSIYRSREMRQRLHALRATEQFDLAHFDTIGLAQYFDDVGNVPRVMTHHGAESYMIRRRIQRESNPIKRAYFVYEWLALQRYERIHCPRFDANIVMSADDGAILRRSAPDATFIPIENGVDIGFFTPVPPMKQRALIFAGRLDQYSNRDGILNFMQTVWTTLRQQHPDVVIHIIGNNPPDILRRMAEKDSQIKVHGFVPDVRPFFSESAAMICPLRDGGGTRIKILDGLALGIPIVSTSVGIEGIAVVPERDLLVADSPEAFVRQITRVFSDTALRARLATNARALAEQRYSWDSLADDLGQLYGDLVEGHAAGGSRSDIAGASERMSSGFLPRRAPIDAQQAKRG